MTGIHRNVPFSDYLAWPGISQSTLKGYARSPKHGRHLELHGREASASLRFGDAADAAIFEPERFARDYVALPKFDGHPNSKVHKEAKAAWEASNADKVIITSQQMADAMELRDTIRRNKRAWHLLAEAKGIRQLSFAWVDAETGLACKGRCDVLCQANYEDLKGPCLVDLKTTRWPDPSTFPKDVGLYSYHMQLAFYLDGLNAISPAARRPIIVAVENAAPFDVVTHELSSAAIESGRIRYRRLLRNYRECQDKNHWPGTCEGINLLSLRRWDEEVES